MFTLKKMHFNCEPLDFGTTGCCEGVSISNIGQKGHMYCSTKFYASTQKCKVQSIWRS